MESIIVTESGIRYKERGNGRMYREDSVGGWVSTSRTLTEIESEIAHGKRKRQAELKHARDCARRSALKSALK